MIEKKAYAKVNLGLKVLKKRDDGYHPLLSYFHLIDLCDELFFNIESSNELCVNITGNDSYLKPNECDLIEKAAILFSKEINIKFKLDLTIIKNIPFQAGLGGGSSDASTTLVTLNEYFNNPLDTQTLQKLSLLLGSDVPFFTSGYSSAFVTGRGEFLEKADKLSYNAMIVKKDGSKVSTKEAFKRLDERKEIYEEYARWPIDYFETNDFDFLQEIRGEAEFKKMCEEAIYNSTTGSGSCQILLFKDDDRFNIFKAKWLNKTKYVLIPTKLI